MFTVLEKLALIIDGFRVIPRLLIATYMFVFLQTTDWYMELEKPTGEQTAFVGAIIGAGAAWFGLYVNTGRRRE